MRLLPRAVSVLLVAIFATLASADVLCLLPCAAGAASHHDGAGDPPADHCGGATPSSSGEPALAAGADSCAAQHAWDTPAADRTAARPSLEPAMAATAVGGDSITRHAEGWTSAPHEDPPGSLAHTSAPLRI